MKTHVIGTAGHIDHGKSTLIKALTGINPDRLKEEQEREMTIDLGFAYLDLPSGRRVSIVDVPGHERFIKNMLAGASGIDLVLFVVAADEGMMPQSREHLDILNLLGLKHGILVITKIDMVDEEWLELIIEDIREEVKGTFLENAPLVKVSSVKGIGLDELKALIDEHFDKIEDRPVESPARYPIDRVFKIAGFGTVVSGTLWEGKISTGDELTLHPHEINVRVRNLQSHGVNVETAEAAVRLAINISGAEKSDIERGNVLASPGYFTTTRMIDAELTLLEDAVPLSHAEPVHFYHGTVETIGKVRILYKEVIEPGETAYVQIILEDPIVAKRKDRFIIRRFSPLQTIGGGVVLNPYPQRKRLNEESYLEEFKVYKEADDREFLMFFISKAAYDGADMQKLKLNTAMLEDKIASLLREFEKQKRVFKLGESWFDSSIVDEGKQHLLSIMESYFKQNPWSPGIDREELRSRAGISNRRLYSHLLEKLKQEERIVSEADLVNLAGREVDLSPKEREIKQKIESLFLKDKFNPPAPQDVWEMFDRDMKTAKRMFDSLVEEKVLVKIAPDIYFHARALSEAKEKVKDYLEKNGKARIAELRDLLGTSRKYAVPLMEYLDKIKFTKRVGDFRVLA